MTTVLAYLQVSKLEEAGETVEARLRDRACGYGSPIQRIFRELGSPVGELMSLVAGVDTDLGGGVIERLHRLAADRGARVENLLASPLPSPALWALLGAVGRLGSDCVVVVPSPAHFDGLGVARHLITGCLSAQRVEIVYLQSPSAAGEIVAELEIPARPLADQIARLHLTRGLRLGGLADYVAPATRIVEALLAETISDGFDHLDRRVWLEVRRSPTTPAIVLRFTDSHCHDSDIPEAVIRFCDTVGATCQRFRTAAATVTVCEITLTALDTATATTPLRAPTPDPAPTSTIHGAELREGTRR